MNDLIGQERESACSDRHGGRLTASCSFLPLGCGQEQPSVWRRPPRLPSLARERENPHPLLPYEVLGKSVMDSELRAGRQMACKQSTAMSGINGAQGWQ